LFVRPAPSRLPPEIGFVLHFTLRTSNFSQLGLFVQYRSSRVPRPRPTRPRQEVGFVAGTTPGNEALSHAWLRPIGFVCTASPASPWRRAAGLSESAIRNRTIGFVSPESRACLIHHNSFPGKHLALSTRRRNWLCFARLAPPRAGPQIPQPTQVWLCLLTATPLLAAGHPQIGFVCTTGP
jgi:hypothetical protein